MLVHKKNHSYYNRSFLQDHNIPGATTNGEALFQKQKLEQDDEDETDIWREALPFFIQYKLESLF